MDIINRFSLVDFLAYLFPGIIGSLGIVMLLLLTPLQDEVSSAANNITAGILFLTASYIVGVLIAGFSEIVTKWRGAQRFGELQSSIPLPGFEDDILRTFQAVFEQASESKVQWTRTHFYLCRALVHERMPGAAQVVQRQSGLRQLRMNLIFPALIWLCVGIGWGIWNLNNGLTSWGLVLIIGSLVLFVPTLMMIFNRMHSNEYREVREVLVAFLAGHKAGLFNRPKSEPK
jgi:uncharacterized membrane protein YhaH (DUF805 family)